MNDIEMAVKAAFINYLKTYFNSRNLEQTLLLMVPEFTGYGTGLDEICYDFKACQDLYSRDIQEAPNPIDYEIIDMRITALAENFGIVMARLNLTTTILNQEIKFNHLRLSLTFVNRDREWLIGNMHISFPSDLHDEGEAYPLKELEEQNKVLERLVDEKTRELQKMVSEVQKLSVTDYLTRLYNREKIEECLIHEINRSKRYWTKFSLIMIDIDDFKQVNDCYGHLTGDRVLVAFSELLSSSTREADCVGRWGGEEFIIICPETEFKQVLQLVEKIRKTVEEYSFGVERKITASFGVSCFDRNDTSESIVSRADQALYKAKNSGKNQVVAE